MQKPLATQARRLLANNAKVPRVQPVTFIVQGSAVSGYIMATNITDEGQITYYLDTEGNLYTQQHVLTAGEMVEHRVEYHGWDNLTRDEISLLRRSFNWFLEQFPSDP